MESRKGMNVAVVFLILLMISSSVLIGQVGAQVSIDSSSVKDCLSQYTAEEIVKLREDAKNGLLNLSILDECAKFFLPEYFSVLNFEPREDQINPPVTKVKLESTLDTTIYDKIFDIDVVITPSVSVSGIQFDISYDPSLVEVVRVSESSFLSQTGYTTFFSPGTIDNEVGLVKGTYGVITVPNNGVTSRETFALVTFQAKSKEGLSSITITNVVIGDPIGVSIAIDKLDTSVLVLESDLVLKK